MHPVINAITTKSSYQHYRVTVIEIGDKNSSAADENCQPLEQTRYNPESCIVNNYRRLKRVHGLPFCTYM